MGFCRIFGWVFLATFKDFFNDGSLKDSWIDFGQRFRDFYGILLDFLIDFLNNFWGFLMDP